MASKTITTLIDDIDGGAADETLAFALDGTTYEIDLCAANAADLRDALAPWLAKARRLNTPSAATGGPLRARKARGGTGRPPRADTAALRAWGRAHGWPDLGTRGRGPAEVHAAHRAATGGAA